MLDIWPYFTIFFMLLAPCICYFTLFEITYSLQFDFSWLLLDVELFFVMGLRISSIFLKKLFLFLFYALYGTIV